MNQSKKFFATASVSVAALLSLGLALPAQAASLSATQIQAVVSLLQAFGADATSIANVQQALSGVQTSGAASTTAISSGMIGLLKLGDRGDAVKLLQTILAADPSILSTDNVSGYFGPLTQKALKAYQKKHGLEQVGFVGPKTLRELESELEDNPLSVEHEDTASSTAPRIGKGKLCAIVPPGHLIAPGWLKKNDGKVPVIPPCQTLPEGIAKKLGGGGTGTTTPDTTAPTISGILMTDITATGATVKWQTNEKATSVVSFGTTTAYGLTASTGVTRTLDHSVMLTGLAPSTLYHLRISSVDGAGNSASSSDLTLSTLSTADTTTPIISGVSVNSIASTSATVSWVTNEGATSKVYYGTATPLALATALTATGGSSLTTHAVPLSSLTASTTYYYVVESADTAGNTATSSEAGFTTLAQ